jgi:hypothetical protein
MKYKKLVLLFISIFLIYILINIFNLREYSLIILAFLIIIVPVILIIYFIFKSTKILDTKQEITLFIICGLVILVSYILTDKTDLLVIGYFVPIIMYSYIKTIGIISNIKVKRNIRGLPSYPHRKGVKGRIQIYIVREENLYYIKLSL